MRRIAVGILASMLVLAIAAAPAAAQKKEALKARGYFGVGGGLALPVGDYADAFKTGWDADVFGGVTTKGGLWGVRADLMWAQNNLKAGLNGHERLAGLNADLVITPGHRPADWHPYFLAGIGVYNGKESAAGVTGSDTKLAVNAGAGIQIHTGHRMDVFLEGRFVTIRTSGSALNFVPFNVGFRWGGI
jgi:opacity protein-like surface antigen